MTHAHIDHIALLPALVQQGFKGEIIGSHPTIALILAGGIERPENDIVFVGYQADGTPGRVIQENAKGNGTVVLDGKESRIEASVHNLSGYSAHADQKGLLDWVERMPEKPGTIELTLALQKSRMLQILSRPRLFHQSNPNLK